MVLRLAAAGRLSLSFARLIPRKGEGVIGFESPLISSSRVRSDARISVLGQEIGAKFPVVLQWALQITNSKLGSLV